MIKIGILGSDSSHALAFSTLCNIPNEATGKLLYPNVRIVTIYGHDEIQTKQIAIKGNIPHISDTIEDVLKQVDAVMILFRDGNLHTKYALPFLEANIPVWMDKPFTVDILDSKILLEKILLHRCLITGGSTCKYNENVLELSRIASSNELGTIISGYMNFPGDINSPYHGIHFYGPHMAEMIFTIFGYDVLSVTTIEHQSQLICTLKYPTKMVILNFNTNIQDSTCIIHGDKKSHTGKIVIDSSTYKEGFIKFIEMLETKRMPISIERLIAPVILLNAITNSIYNKKEVFLESYYEDIKPNI